MPERQKLVAGLVKKGIGILMVVLYIVFGTTIIFRASEIQNLPTHYGIIMGVVLILYGLYRGYRLFKTQSTSHEE
jgi:hypothetical protein